jgi:hypothetical protein
VESVKEREEGKVKERKKDFHHTDESDVNVLLRLSASAITVAPLVPM